MNVQMFKKYKTQFHVVTYAYEFKASQEILQST